MLTRAEGEARQVIAEAQGYAAKRVNAAKGEADRFTAVYEAYLDAPDVTRQRMYLEMIDKVLPQAGRIFIMDENQTAPLPLLNLGDSSVTVPATR